MGVIKVETNKTIQHAIEDSIKFLESYPDLPIERIGNTKKQFYCCGGILVDEAHEVLLNLD
jgi:hypothetical protein